ncbi:hypothetical protein PG_1649 [Porphyromonas gingivalis W83]|uniref:Uncharacterized protein n=1 Tax=Porphyromonas gingivalis (strain ATCC BAA-308 / W83) TaxID=242619 RepID=Q7MU94_PORGI|nr:hypothetical protein [Porphyromonas gingivalis]AAQ66669.1 hypothetical protein PG_1649 [Porphyromonas gingivalis W83]EIW90638.1 hypothetical protein HMPREF1322_0035 [Porphyromonas gingivalis W50]
MYSTTKDLQAVLLKNTIHIIQTMYSTTKDLQGAVNVVRPT